MTNEEALALGPREWRAYLRTLGERRKAELRRLRKNALQQSYRERMDAERAEREREHKRNWWIKNRTDEEFRKKRAARERRRYRKAKGA